MEDGECMISTLSVKFLYRRQENHQSGAEPFWLWLVHIRKVPRGEFDIHLVSLCDELDFYKTIR